MYSDLKFHVYYVMLEHCFTTLYPFDPGKQAQVDCMIKGLYLNCIISVQLELAAARVSIIKIPSSRPI